MRSLNLQTLCAELLQYAADGSIPEELQQLLRKIRSHLQRLDAADGVIDVPLSNWSVSYPGLSQFIDE